MARRSRLRLAMLAHGAALALLALGPGCASWRTVARHEGWTLRAEPGQAVDEALFTRAFDPALRTVEQIFGSFEHTVDVHAVAVAESGPPLAAGALSPGALSGAQYVPGIGPARVRAWHLRSSALFGAPSGIYVAVPETGTAAHELVHARLAEQGGELPLWLEEGIASYVGDGFLAHDTWIVDGLACWPLRELAEQRLSDEELARLCALRAEEASDSRENVLAHFVGWALVFDLASKSGGIAWRDWIARYGHGISTSEARARLSRTLQPETLEAWLERLADPSPAVRMATAKGLWKLRSERVLRRLLDALDAEKDPEAQVALSINVLATAGEMPLSPDLLGRVWRTVWPRLRRAHLEDKSEDDALHELMRSVRFGSNRAAQGPLDLLRRLWAE